MPQKLTTTACFIQEESSGGKQFRKLVSFFYAQRGNVGVLSLKYPEEEGLLWAPMPLRLV